MPSIITVLGRGIMIRPFGWAAMNNIGQGFTDDTYVPPTPAPSVLQPTRAECATTGITTAVLASNGRTTLSLLTSGITTAEIT